MRFACLLLLTLALAACSHEAENTGVENSSVIILPQRSFAMVTTTGQEMPVQANPQASAVHQIQPSSPCAENFDNIMDYLEALMAQKRNAQPAT